MIEISDRDSLAHSPSHDVALDCIEAGIEAANPERVIEETVSVEDGSLHVDDATYDLGAFEEVIVLGGGKAAAQVARALERVLGDVLEGGIVVTSDPVDTERVTVLPGDHPVPSQRGVESTERLLARAHEADADTLVLGVITGGGSALMPAPAEGISLEDLGNTTDMLLRSGATIHEFNAVRKHLSVSKGGQLAKALDPATTVALILSDVVGNDLDVIASGPMVPDSSTFEDAMSVIERFDVDVPDAVMDRLVAGTEGHLEETPKPGDPIFDRVSTHIIADGFTALAGARDVATERGYDPLVLSSRIEGESRESAKTHAAIAAEIQATGNPVDPPAVILSGGETTVTMKGSGTGGPNQEFVLGGTLGLPEDCVLAAVDTDGIDGKSDAAGGILDRDGLDVDEARSALRENDSGSYLAERDAQIVTGKTGTNVNDLRVLVVESPDT
ncbi:MAG: glycerate kinase type-2 family protein [Halodesulfurarchaeum sp.]